MKVGHSDPVSWQISWGDGLHTGRNLKVSTSYRGKDIITNFKTDASTTKYTGSYVWLKTSVLDKNWHNFLKWQTVKTLIRLQICS